MAKEREQIASPMGRFSFVSLAKPSDFSSKYEVTLLFDKEADLTVLKKAAAEQIALAKTKQGSGVKLKSPFRDAGEKDHLDGYKEGMTFVSFRTTNKPMVIDSRRNEIDPHDPEGLYSGCYGRVTFSCFHYDQQGNKGVSFGLIAVQKARDGEHFGFVSNTDGLDALEEPETDGAEESAEEFDLDKMFS